MAQKVPKFHLTRLQSPWNSRIRNYNQFHDVWNKFEVNQAKNEEIRANLGNAPNRDFKIARKISFLKMSLMSMAKFDMDHKITFVWDQNRHQFPKFQISKALLDEIRPQLLILIILRKCSLCTSFTNIMGCFIGLKVASLWKNQSHKISGFGQNFNVPFYPQGMPLGAQASNAWKALWVSTFW